METTIYQSEQIEEIAALIRAGGMVAIPTDTVYGLAIASTNLRAIENMKRAKGRPEEKPFPMMVSSLAQLETVAIVDEKTRKVIEFFMPGALTIIFRKRPELPKELTNGFSTVGIRMPDDQWVLALIKAVGVPLLVPSANLSGAAVCNNHNEVLAQLSGRIDAVVAGVSGSGLSSTIVDMSGEKIKILRPGKITLEEIMEVLK